MLTVIDTETTVQFGERGEDPSPFNPSNLLVAVGVKQDHFRAFHCVNHTQHTGYADWGNDFQRTLNGATLLIGHNIKFDLSWLREVGFTYNGPIYDTMITEYVLAEGLHVDLDLSSCCARYGIETKKDILSEYLAKGINVNEIPWPELEEYGLHDVEITWALFWKQLERLGRTPEECMIRI
jgi:DNA polymerase I-like protein with 3'-5' exonuclease and polymerase domains